MSVGLLGNKIGMTQIFDESGNIIPVTILKVGPCIVTQIKTVLTDGYNAIQIGYGTVSNKSLTQPELGHLQKSNIQPLKYLKEFRVNDPEEFEVGQVLNVESLAPGSIGMGTTPGRVLPGKKMSGQLGNKMAKTRKLKVVQVNSNENILVVKGSVPGKPGNLLSIRVSPKFGQ